MQEAGPESASNLGNWHTDRAGLSELGLARPRFEGRNTTIMYFQGPIIKEQDLPANVTRLAIFRTEIHSKHENQTKGEMVNTPAMHSIEYGKGRVLLNSPHPELVPRIPEIYAGELKWAVVGRGGE